MTEFKIGDKVWVELQVVEASGDMIQVVSGPNQQPYQTAVLGWAHASDLRSSAGPGIMQAIRAVLLSDEFMAKFAAAWMKTPLPIGEYAEPGEPTNANTSGLCCGGLEADPENFGECGHCGNMLCGRLQKSVDGESCPQANARVIPGTPVGWELVGFKKIQDEVKVFDENGDYWTFSGTNDAGDLTGALMPIFKKIEATNDPT